MERYISSILVVDDNAGIRSALKILLPMRFAEVELIASPKVLMETMRTFKPDVVLLDMNFETDINTGNEGLFWLSELKRDFPEVEVVLFTAYADIALAVEGMKRGAFDFVVKPWDNAKLLATLEEACKKHRKVTGKASLEVDYFVHDFGHRHLADGCVRLGDVRDGAPPQGNRHPSCAWRHGAADPGDVQLALC